MASVFYGLMSINYILPISECDLGITSKSQYGFVTGVWFAGWRYKFANVLSQ